MQNDKEIMSQIETGDIILDFLSGFEIKTPDDLVILKDKILNYFTFRPYEENEVIADEIQWKRSASEIIKDAYVYSGKACSDLAIVFLALCKACGIPGLLVKLKSIDNDETHSIVEVKIDDGWYRIDPSSKDAQPFVGQLTSESIWNKKFKVWKKGEDLWSLGLKSISDENIIKF